MIAVTGASGNVGSEVIRRLVEQGVPVRALVTDPDRALPHPPTTGEATRFDFLDPTSYEAAFEGVSSLFLVRPPQLAKPKKEINPAIDAAVVAGVRRIVFLSLQGVERNPVVPHYKIEKHLREANVATTMLRPSFFMQNLTTAMLPDIRDRDEIFVPAGSGRTSFVDCRDIGEVGAAALRDESTESRAHELTGSEAPSYDEVASTLSAVLGRPIHYARPSPLAYWRRVRAAGDPRGFALVTTALYTVARLGQADTVTPELGEMLGRPPTTLRRFIDDHAEVWR